MGNTRDPQRDQQLPIENDEPYCHDMMADDVRARFGENSEVALSIAVDLEERKEHGTKKYGAALQPHNGRDFYQDAYEEALDLGVYLRGKLEEMVDEDVSNETRHIFQDHYQMHLELVASLRSMMDGLLLFGKGSA